MGNLTLFLQERFAALCPPGWGAYKEVRLLSPGLEKKLGYSPRADVVLRRDDGAMSLWIEFEVSRADPVANHAKFATSHLFEPQQSTDAFISMVSSHVAPGRRNLAANTIIMMRRIGMHAFQTTLLPLVSIDNVKRLNHLPLEDLRLEIADEQVAEEIGRALFVSTSLFEARGYQLYFAANTLEVMLNVRNWNVGISEERQRRLWGTRTITYFVYDPVTQWFAPSKFCAYLTIPKLPGNPTVSGREEAIGMTIDRYVQFDSSDHKFDGAMARKHLERNLAMVIVSYGDDEKITADFNAWFRRHEYSVAIHPNGPVLMIAPMSV